MGKVKFVTITKSEYTAATKDADTLYFVTDSKLLYKGSVLYAPGNGVTGVTYNATTDIMTITNADATTSQISFADEFSLKEDKSNKGKANGYASLGDDGKVPSTQLPSYVDDVHELVDTVAANPTSGMTTGAMYYNTTSKKIFTATSATAGTESTPESHKIYIVASNNKTYRWSGSDMVVISETLALGETDATAYRGDRGKTAYDHSQVKDGTNPHGTTGANINATITDGTATTTLPTAGTATAVNTLLGSVRNNLKQLFGYFSSGSANSAVKLQTARTISLSGDVTGSNTFDGSANSAIAATLATSGVTAGAYGESGSTRTLAAGGAFIVPEITVDAKGRATSAKEVTLTLPAAPTTVSGNAGSATKLATARAIDGVSFDGTAAIAHYGSCSTAAATAEKAVSITSFTLVTGALALVKFTVTNTAASPTLNVNGTGGKSIFYRGAAISAGYLAANRTYLFAYNGTQFELVGDINTDNNTTYSVLDTTTGTAGTDTASRVVRADYLKSIITTLAPPLEWTAYTTT